MATKRQKNYCHVLQKNYQMSILWK